MIADASQYSKGLQLGSSDDSVMSQRCHGMPCSSAGLMAVPARCMLSTPACCLCQLVRGLTTHTGDCDIVASMSLLDDIPEAERSSWSMHLGTTSSVRALWSSDDSRQASSAESSSSFAGVRDPAEAAGQLDV